MKPVLEILESEAVARICQNPQQMMVSKLEIVHLHMRKMLPEVSQVNKRVDEKFSIWQTADRNFHQILLCATGNRRLLDIIDGLCVSLKIIMSSFPKDSNILRYQSPLAIQSHAQQTFEEHSHILKMLKQRDGDAARSAMTQHIRFNLEMMLACFNDNYMCASNGLIDEVIRNESLPVPLGLLKN